MIDLKSDDWLRLDSSKHERRPRAKRADHFERELLNMTASKPHQILDAYKGSDR